MKLGEGLAQGHLDSKTGEFYAKYLPEGWYIAQYGKSSNFDGWRISEAFEIFAGQQTGPIEWLNAPE